MDSISILSAKPQRLVVGEETFAVHPLTLDDFGTLQAWVNSQFRDPFDVIEEQVRKHPERWNVAKQEHAMRLALKESVAGPPKIGTAAADVLLATPDGVAEVLYLSVAKGDPVFTREKARDVVCAINSGVTSRLFAATNANMVMHDPKARRPTGAASGSGAPRRSRKAARRSATTA